METNSPISVISQTAIRLQDRTREIRIRVCFDQSLSSRQSINQSSNQSIKQTIPFRCQPFRVLFGSRHPRFHLSFDGWRPGCRPQRSKNTQRVRTRSPSQILVHVREPVLSGKRRPEPVSFPGTYRSLWLPRPPSSSLCAPHSEWPTANDVPVGHVANHQRDYENKWSS